MSSCECQNCGWEGEDGETTTIDDLFERVESGDIMPSGQCPKCGALCYPWVAMDLLSVDQLTRRVGDSTFVITRTDDGLQVEVRSAQLLADHLNIRMTGEGLIIDGVRDGEIEGSFARMWGELEHNFLEGDEE